MAVFAILFCVTSFTVQHSSGLNLTVLNK